MESVTQNTAALPIISMPILPMTTNATTTAINATKKPIFDYYNQGTPFDIAMDFLLTLSLVVSLYLLVALLAHEWLFIRNNRCQAVAYTQRKSKTKIGPWLRLLCIASAFFTMLRCANDIAYYKGQTTSHIPCTILKNLGVSWLTGVDMAVYLFLWLRHRVLYQNRSLRLTGNPVTTVASWLALFLIGSLFVAINAILLGWRHYEYDPVTAKCTKLNKMANIVLSKTFVIGSSILHIILVGLYIFPLVRQTMNMRRSKQLSQPATENYTQGMSTAKVPSPTKKGNLMKVVVRCVLLSLLCILTDGLAIIAQNHWIPDEGYSKMRHFVYDFNIIINVVAIVASFKNWKQMLFPFCISYQSKAGNGKKDSTSTTYSLHFNAAHRVPT